MLCTHRHRHNGGEPQETYCGPRHKSPNHHHNTWTHNLRKGILAITLHFSTRDPSSSSRDKNGPAIALGNIPLACSEQTDLNPASSTYRETQQVHWSQRSGDHNTGHQSHLYKRNVWEAATPWEQAIMPNELRPDALQHTVSLVDSPQPVPIPGSSHFAAFTKGVMHLQNTNVHLTAQQWHTVGSIQGSCS